ncbi:hypothetical protein [Streptomyces ortus]|uniref:Uncharacterized protein n=1 Tax=Streptomyces ortus TaxID=2867268 RepID=A0ABT3VCG1_9ACTN|nr:hypothetical protein [Streptomyces ortus]MCX4237629.1 hypothetical protein [Streptomyces ortus]
MAGGSLHRPDPAADVLHPLSDPDARESDEDDDGGPAGVDILVARTHWPGWVARRIRAT